jgi:hypothetical protein
LEVNRFSFGGVLKIRRYVLPRRIAFEGSLAMVAEYWLFVVERLL